MILFLEMPWGVCLPGVELILAILAGLASISPLFPSSRNDALELVKWPWTGAGP